MPHSHPRRWSLAGPRFSRLHIRLFATRRAQGILFSRGGRLFVSAVSSCSAYATVHRSRNASGRIWYCRLIRAQSEIMSPRSVSGDILLRIGVIKLSSGQDGSSGALPDWRLAGGMISRQPSVRPVVDSCAGEPCLNPIQRLRVSPTGAPGQCWELPADRCCDTHDSSVHVARRRHRDAKKGSVTTAGASLQGNEATYRGRAR